MEIIPKDTIKLLPFVPEPLISLSKDSDLGKYLSQLFDKTGLMITPEGDEITVNYNSYSFYRLGVGIEEFKFLAKRFQEYAQNVLPAPAAENKVELIPDFELDINFGHLAKCAIAWDCTVSEVLSESAFFSLTHILEAESELNCSILLSSNLYYKQALQVLRNYLEGMTLQLYFCDERSKFTKWKKGQFRTPAIRGKDGILKKLTDLALLPNDLADSISNLYGNLKKVFMERRND